MILNEDIANVLEYYFSGGRMGVNAEEQSTAWFPGAIVIAEDGSEFSYIRRPAHVDASNVDTKNYVGMLLKDCQKRSGKECYLFASGYKILWDNGSDKKRRKLKRIIDIMREEMMTANAPGASGGFGADSPAKGPRAGFSPVMGKVMKRKKSLGVWSRSLRKK